MVKIYCNDCGKELFGGMDENVRDTTTLKEVDNVLCSDCQLEHFSEKGKKARAPQISINLAKAK